MTCSIMIQGTTSNAGKSLMVAALCRIFRQDGHAPAPFKSQNMALNSYITYEGLEMGRAQVMQAEAAGIEPQVAMNPILLKPTSDVGSQVIVDGEVLGTMKAAEYFAFKQTLKPRIKAAYDRLAAEHDIIVLEGAGSPAEINLKHDDIVNMGMAKMAGAPVLIVGDIDPGGVFASLYGTIALLDEDERRLVKGTIINKFRGDVSLLEPGLVQLEELTDVPCLGVVPYLDLDLDDEDSLSERLANRRTTAPVDIAVIRLPHISNFTDLNPLGRYSQVSVRYVDRVDELGTPACVVLPGTKSTMADLAWLREEGFDRVLGERAYRGELVLGICGGYQMLGQVISDAEGIEGPAGTTVEGLGLLPAFTSFAGDKVRTRATARTGVFTGPLATLSGQTLSGYEIHMGQTSFIGASGWGTSAGTTHAARGVTGFATLEDSDAAKVGEDGCVCGSVIGTYLHGLFEGGTFADAFVRLLCARVGVEPTGFPQQSFWDHKQRQYDMLADAVRESLDMERIYAILEEDV